VLAKGVHIGPPRRPGCCLGVQVVALGDFGRPDLVEREAQQLSGNPNWSGKRRNWWRELRGKERENREEPTSHSNSTDWREELSPLRRSDSSGRARAARARLQNWSGNWRNWRGIETEDREEPITHSNPLIGEKLVGWEGNWGRERRERGGSREGNWGPGTREREGRERGEQTRGTRGIRLGEKRERRELLSSFCRLLPLAQPSPWDALPPLKPCLLVLLVASWPHDTMGLTRC
jgi:hypothetical protein